LSASDANDGGAGRDVLILQGDYAGPNSLTLGDHNLDNVEALSLQSGSVTRWGDNGTHLYSYNITSVDANVAAGTALIVNGGALLLGENFTFNGSAETDGSFVFYGGFGTDHLTGGAGNDVFYFEGDRWNPTDTANGGTGRDVVVVTGSINGINHIDVASGQLVNIDAFSVSNVYATNPAVQPSYDVVLHDGNVTPGGSLIVNANTLTKPTQTFALDAHEVTGTLLIFGGAGADSIVSGSGNDVIYAGFGQDAMTGGAGADIFQFRSLGDSTPGAADHILDFVSGTDKIDLSFIDADPSTAGDNAFVLSNDGTFHNVHGEIREFFDVAHGWWVVDADVNGDGQSDFSIHVTTAGNAPLVFNDFIL
jgi:Ca2+-binding RTX toxin-like protein